MNRLILIGNGFDLAHGLKTSYNDFILWYLKNSFTKAYTYLKYEDELISITKYSHYINYDVNEFVSGYVDRHYENGFKNLFANDGYNSFTKQVNPFRISIKSDLLSTLLQNCSDSNWVDIENEFYEQLKSILLSDKIVRTEAVTIVNNSLKNIIDLLESYLKNVTTNHWHQGYFDILQSEIKLGDMTISKHRLYDESLKLKDSLVLNFNYTSTIEMYFKPNDFNIQPKKYPVNYIHGQLGATRNPLIFGFGDELDEAYLKMELEKTKGFFEYIKSFWYFKTSNYHNLIRFIDSSDFQVFILGHSCGLSDRTMLNMIFEHDNCKSIKIYYYEDKEGNNNFTTLTQEISRHFKNKGDMRKKIVPFDKSEPMPQVLID